MDKTKIVKSKPKPIAPFKSYEEEANFWDKNTTEKKWKKSEIGEILEKERKIDLVNLKVSPSLKKRIEDKASEYDISVSSLIRMWVVEKLNNS